MSSTPKSWTRRRSRALDLYIVLGLARGASAADIKRAYRRLARRLHPDINPGDGEAAERFRQILDAYETLIDPERRRRYDAGATTDPVDRRAARSAFPGSISRAPGVERSTTFGDLFEDVFARLVGAPARRRGRARRRHPSQGQPVVRRGVARRASGRSTVTRQRDVPGVRGHGRPSRPSSRAARLRGRAARCARCAATWCSRRAARSAAAPAGCGSRRASLRRAGRRDARPRSLHVRIPAGDRRRRARARAGEGPRRRARRRARRPLHRRPGGAASAVPARRRRPAHRRADCDSRSGARRAHRDSDAGRPGAAARAARHAVGPALPAARARRAVAARAAPRRPGRRSAADAAARARRAIEGAAAGVRPDQRRRVRPRGGGQPILPPATRSSGSGRRRSIAGHGEANAARPTT